MTLYNSNKCDCNFNSQSAFILLDKDDEPINIIQIEELILNNDIKIK